MSSNPSSATELIISMALSTGTSPGADSRLRPIPAGGTELQPRTDGLEVPLLDDVTGRAVAVDDAAPLANLILDDRRRRRVKGWHHTIRSHRRCMSAVVRSANPRTIHS